MLEKPKRPKQLSNQDRQLPATIQELINRYDLENKDIYKFLDYLIDKINNDKNTVVDSLENIEKKIEEKQANIDEQGRILNEKIVGTVLYEDKEGTKGDVTLVDSADNYDYIEIYYKTASRSGSIKVSDFTDKKLVLSIIAGSSATIVILTKNIVISGTTITQEKAYQYFNNTSNVNQYTEVDDIYIYKVIGYKY